MDGEPGRETLAVHFLKANKSAWLSNRDPTSIQARRGGPAVRPSSRERVIAAGVIRERVIGRRERELVGRL